MFQNKIRYNRPVDIFTKLTCFHLQSHIRTSINNRGQIEIDDLYIGVDRDANRFILPIEAKSASERDKLGWIQVSNLVRFARQFFPSLTCKPLAAKPIDRHRIYLIEFTDEINHEEITIRGIELYKLIRHPTEI